MEIMETVLCNYGNKYSTLNTISNYLHSNFQLSMIGKFSLFWYKYSYGSFFFTVVLFMSIIRYRVFEIKKEKTDA